MFRHSICIPFVSSNAFTSNIYHILITDNLEKNVLKCSITNYLLFSDQVPLKERLDTNVDHERNHSHKLAWHKASTELINQYRCILV